jgi:hypothetical protein
MPLFAIFIWHYIQLAWSDPYSPKNGIPNAHLPVEQGKQAQPEGKAVSLQKWLPSRFLLDGDSSENEGRTETPGNRAGFVRNIPVQRFPRHGRDLRLHKVEVRQTGDKDESSYRHNSRNQKHADGYFDQKPSGHVLNIK